MSCFICRVSRQSWESKSLGLTFHRFPSKQGKEAWTKFALLPEDEDVSNLKLCSRHFKTEDLIFQGWRTKLKRGAVPCFYSTFLDHEFSRNVKCSEEKERGPKPQEKDQNQCLLQGVRKELCRLCGQKGLPLKPIFGECVSEIEEKFPVSAKIEMHLPFKVALDDPLPFKICLQCFETLNRWHELYVTCVAANAVLWKTFGEEFHESSEKNKTNAICRYPENVELYSEFCSQDETDKENSTVDQANQTEELETHCSVCGLGNISSLSEQKEYIVDDFGSSSQNLPKIFQSFKCFYCSELFTTRGERKEHLLTCRELSTICEICGKHITARKYINRHRHAYHGPVLARLCEECGKSFATPTLLKKHLEVIHQRDEPKYYCKLCCTPFYDNTTFLYHQKQHEKGKLKSVFLFQEILEGSDATLYVCPVCQEIFSDALSLVVHLNVKKVLRCPICYIPLRSEKRSMLHVCHEYRCSYCPKIFYNKVKCSLHERMHTGEKPVNCRICDKPFRTRELRKRHENTHNPSFQCSYCGKKFKDENVFNDHVQGHEGKPFLCSICGKQYSGERSMKRHMLRTHAHTQLKNRTQIEFPPTLFMEVI